MRGGLFEGVMLWMNARVGPGGNKSALASFETTQRWIVHVFADIFSSGLLSLIGG